ncbi:hypothetical protein F7Q99_07855 [Streptomyces kaniharaensis]|uniref:Uncharacterized protein n=1 Tax=Streptomyces kaniharaensis TaxID=212423 RepID=A0A6N7KL05_9ACTN|nr:hypothetical protein [Streptomyces kaniharaensis]MQS12210.1 hypothetical protein [Streptomyces kaniharaensis]
MAQTHVDMAHGLLLRLLPDGLFKAQIPGLLDIVKTYLGSEDPRRKAAEGASEQLVAAEVIRLQDRETVIDAVRGARLVLQYEGARARNFIRILYWVTAVLFTIAVVLAVFGAYSPLLVPLCFGDVPYCPTGNEPASWDYTVIELVGIMAAAIAAAVSLRRLKGPTIAYGIPVALAVLKLPTGALTALAGLMLMRGEFVPGLTSLSSSAQIIAYGIVFGYAQEAGTRLIDKQGQEVVKALGVSANSPSSSTL